MAHIREKPPLRVGINIETPSGKHYRWAEDEPDAQNVPNGLRFSDTMPGGFESFDCTLPRKPGVDYSDLERLSTITVRGASGDIAGEYRLERAPRTSGDLMAISPSAVGWQAHLEDDKSAREIYVDRDLSHWTTTSRERRIQLIQSSSKSPREGSVSPSATDPGLEQYVDGDWQAGRSPWVEMIYDAGGGVTIAAIHFRWTRLSTTSATDWYWDVGSSAAVDGALTGFISTGDRQNEPDTTAGGYYTSSPAQRFGHLRFGYGNDANGNTAPGLQFGVVWTTVAVYGNHGLGRRGADPGGLYASDVVAHAVSRWAPLLAVTSDSIQPSGFIVPHFVFLEPTTAGEIVRQATRFGLQDWAVWDNKTFWWHERGVQGLRWRARVAPTQLEETGPQVDRIWESVVVSFSDVDGSTRTVGPPGSGADTEDAALKDSDPENPANKLGVVRRDLLQMGTSTAAGAVEVGRRFLEESRLLDSSGRARIVGHCEDDKGVLHPYHRLRAGDYISFVDSNSTGYRRIVRSEKDHSSRTCSIDLDSPPDALASLLERLSVVLVPLSL